MSDMIEQGPAPTDRGQTKSSPPRRHESREYREIDWRSLQRRVLPALSVIFLLAGVADVVLYTIELDGVRGLPSALPYGVGVWFIAALLCWILLAIGRLEKALKDETGGSREP